MAVPESVDGRDWRTGLVAWSAPVAGDPALSLAWKRLTGDGPEGSAEGVLRPRRPRAGRLAPRWRLGLRPQPRGGRGVSLDLDTRLVSLDDGRSAGAGMEAEVGLWLVGRAFPRARAPLPRPDRLPGRGIHPPRGGALPARHPGHPPLGRVLGALRRPLDGARGAARAPPVLTGHHLRRSGPPAV